MRKDNAVGEGLPFTEVLAESVDQTRLEAVKIKDYLARHPEYRQELEPLLYTAQTIRKNLPPIRPSPAFQESLREALVHSARAQESRRRGVPPSIQVGPSPRLSRGLLVAMALAVLTCFVLGLRRRRP
ncbi:MAG: hypothetical protein HY871_07580 [Chloroflexi bacterium]|nr:hypothetical protein [Chloroflexota bacterium]